MNTKHYQGDEFPIHIDLGKMPDDGPGSPEVASDGGKKEKRKPYYPTLYISGIEGLGDLPKDGCALIEFHRNRLSVDTPEDGKDAGSVELQIKTICLMEPKEGEGEDLKSMLANGLKKAGVDVGDAASDDDREEDEP